MNHLQQAIEFRQTYKQPIRSGELMFMKGDDPLISTLRMQIGCIQEEGNELVEAISTWVLASDGDAELVPDAKIHVIKELADLVYVCYQLAAFLGVNIGEALDRVHLSNMSKLDENGQPIFNQAGKVMKGPNYKEPDLSDLA